MVYDMKDQFGHYLEEYKVGDIYPREGLDPSPQRIAELLGPDNARHRPVIEVIKRQRKKG